MVMVGTAAWYNFILLGNGSLYYLFYYLCISENLFVRKQQNRKIYLIPRHESGGRGRVGESTLQWLQWLKNVIYVSTRTTAYCISKSLPSWPHQRGGGLCTVICWIVVTRLYECCSEACLLLRNALLVLINWRPEISC